MIPAAFFLGVALYLICEVIDLLRAAKPLVFCGSIALAIFFQLQILGAATPPGAVLEGTLIADKETALWGIVFLVHYLFVRSIHVEDDWVDERAADLRMKSYDFDHIHTIQGRLADGELDEAPVRRAGKRRAQDDGDP